MLKDIVLYIPRKVVAINNAVNKLAGLPEKVDKSYTIITKVTGATAGTAGAAKGSVDFLEAVACQDGVCAFVSAVGVTADGLQICASFVPGPNVTVVITTPISVGCKVFVWCCKRSKLPWGGC